MERILRSYILQAVIHLHTACFKSALPSCMPSYVQIFRPLQASAYNRRKDILQNVLCLRQLFILGLLAHNVCQLPDNIAHRPESYCWAVALSSLAVLPIRYERHVAFFDNVSQVQLLCLACGVHDAGLLCQQVDLLYGDEVP